MEAIHNMHHQTLIWGRHKRNQWLFNQALAQSTLVQFVQDKDCGNQCQLWKKTIATNQQISLYQAHWWNITIKEIMIQFCETSWPAFFVKTQQNLANLINNRRLIFDLHCEGRYTIRKIVVSHRYSFIDIHGPLTFPLYIFMNYKYWLEYLQHDSG